jgi:HEAT repeat protein
MDAVGDLEKEFLRLLTEDDLFVRAEVIRALAHTDSDEVREALHNVLLDPSMVLQDAAMETLQSLAEREGRVAPIPAIVAERADGTTPQPADYVMEVGP